MDTILEFGDGILVQLGISLLIVLGGYFIGGWALVRLARTLARRAKGAFLAQIPAIVEPQLRWLVLLVSLQIALLRLDIIPAEWREWINTAFGVSYIVVAFLAFWRLIGAGFEWLAARLEAGEQTDALSKLLPLLRQLSYFTLLLVTATILLAYFEINISALVTALGIGGLAISLAAQDTLADAISGALIVLDRPFQVGDRIDVSEVGSPGDVMEIGLRSSRIRLLDNRQVIVPNGVVARSQIVNYSVLDSVYRLTFDFGVSYNSQVEKVQQVVADAVRKAEDVLPDRSVNVYVWELGASALIFRVEWWIDVSSKTPMSGVSVKEAVYQALVESGIEIPNTIYDVNLKLGGDEQALLAGAIRRGDS